METWISYLFFSVLFLKELEIRIVSLSGRCGTPRDFYVLLHFRQMAISKLSFILDSSHTIHNNLTSPAVIQKLENSKGVRQGN